MSTTDVAAADLARELNVTVAVVLQRADDTINRVVDEDGLDAARGLTTRTQGGRIYLTAELAAGVRGLR